MSDTLYSSVELIDSSSLASLNDNLNILVNVVCSARLAEFGTKYLTFRAMLPILWSRFRVGYRPRIPKQDSFLRADSQRGAAELTIVRRKRGRVV